VGRNLYTGTKDDIAHLLDSQLRADAVHDVTFPLYVEVEEIYNLACPASPLHYQHDPVQTIKTSVHGATEVKVRGNAHYEATITRIPHRGKVSAGQ
jgi:hypothetical protein